MSTHDYVIDNQSAPAFRADLNNVLAAIASQNSSGTAPTVTFANMIWYDTGNNQIKKRNETNSAWIVLGTIDETSGTFTPSGERALATEAQAIAGTDNTTLMTPLRAAQASKSHTLLGTLSTTSGTTQTLSGLSLSSYAYVFIKLWDISHNYTASSATLSFGSKQIAFSLNNADYANGLIWLNPESGYSTSIMSGGFSNTTTTGPTGYNASSTSLSFSWNYGSFDNGLIRVYGVK